MPVILDDENGRPLPSAAVAISTAILFGTFARIVANAISVTSPNALIGFVVGALYAFWAIPRPARYRSRLWLFLPLPVAGLCALCWYAWCVFAFFHLPGR